MLYFEAKCIYTCIYIMHKKRLKDLKFWLIIHLVTAVKK